MGKHLTHTAFDVEPARLLILGRLLLACGNLLQPLARNDNLKLRPQLRFI